MATTTTRVGVETMERLREAVQNARGVGATLMPEVDLALQAHADRLMVEAKTGAIQAPPLPDLGDVLVKACVCKPGGVNRLVRVNFVAQASLGKTESSIALAKRLRDEYAGVLAKGLSRSMHNKRKTQLEPVVVESYEDMVEAITAKGAVPVKILVLQAYMRGLGMPPGEQLQHLGSISKALDDFERRNEGQVIVLIIATDRYSSTEKCLRGEFVLFKGRPDDGIEIMCRPSPASRAYAEALVRRIAVEHQRDAMYEWVAILPGYRPGKVNLLGNAA